MNHDCVYPQPPFCWEDIVNNLNIDEVMYM